jgi:hypothetical protein
MKMRQRSFIAFASKGARHLVPQVMRMNVKTVIQIVLSSGAMFAAMPSWSSDNTARNQAAATHEGIWKSVVPPKGMHGEFDNMDVLGLAVGAKIPSDCSLNWVNPDDGKLYCFVSGTSLVVFLEHPHANLQSAQGFWSTLSNSSK